MTDYIAALNNSRAPYHREATRLADDFRTKATVADGVVRWDSNNHVPPLDIRHLWHHLGFVFDWAATQAAYDQDLRETLAAYRAANKNGPCAEERAEVRAAMGSGVEMVNVITGYNWTT